MTMTKGLRASAWRSARRLARLPGTIALLGGAVLVWGGLVEPRRVRVRRARLRLSGWPERLDGLRLALVSDFHAGGPHAREGRLRRVVGRINKQAPDVVLLLGDYVDPAIPGVEPLDPGRVAAALGELRAPLGVLAVLGNHDWANDGDRVAAALRSVGIRVLENEAVALEVSRARLWVAGLADLRTREPQVDRTLPAPDDDAPILLLTHDPDVFPVVPERVTLTLAGHLHGGQIDVPGLRQIVVPSRFGMRYAAGHVEEAGRHLYVSRGVGTSGLPLRLRAPAGFEMLELFAR
jgi:predicted MPP superfamily phosphohydrolase